MLLAFALFGMHQSRVSMQSLRHISRAEWMTVYGLYYRGAPGEGGCRMNPCTFIMSFDIYNYTPGPRN
jgi:hypothetical protein